MNTVMYVKGLYSALSLSLSVSVCRAVCRAVCLSLSLSLKVNKNKKRDLANVSLTLLGMGKIGRDQINSLK